MRIVIDSICPADQHIADIPGRLGPAVPFDQVIWQLGQFDHPGLGLGEPEIAVSSGPFHQRLEVLFVVGAFRLLAVGVLRNQIQ